MVKLTHDAGVAEILLASPATRNAINPDWVTALAAAVEGAACADGVRAVLVRGEGPAFTVGGDLAHFAATVAELPEQLDAMVSRYHHTLRTLAELPVPVVCAAHGAVAGGGLGLLWAADLVLLADGTRLVTGQNRLGLSGDGGASWYLPRLIGTLRATELIMLGRVLGADEAVAWGLANRAVAPDALTSEARAAARELAAGPTAAYAEMRAMIRGAFTRDLASGLDAELAAQIRSGASDDAREGVTAFASRRAPRFVGR